MSLPMRLFDNLTCVILHPLVKRHACKQPHTSRKDETRRCSLHFLQDHIEKGMMDVEYCPTEDRLAVIMMKE